MANAVYAHLWARDHKNVLLYPGKQHNVGLQPAFGPRLLGFKCDSPLSGWATVLCLVFLAATQG